MLNAGAKDASRPIYLTFREVRKVLSLTVTLNLNPV
jgi:hypothetical protein